MAYRELTTKQIEKWLGIKKEIVPKHLVLSAKWPWPQERREREVKEYLKKPKLIAERDLGNFWIGKLGNQDIGFMIIYGPGMAADMLYLLIKLGVKYVYQIGSIGALQKEISLFDVIIPSESIKFEGLIKHSAKEVGYADKSLLKKFENIFKKEGLENFHIGRTISIDFLFAETAELVKKWSQQGLLGIDMETATVYSMCNLFRIKSIALLIVIDHLLQEGKLISDKVHRTKKRKQRQIFIRDAISQVISQIG